MGKLYRWTRRKSVVSMLKAVIVAVLAGLSGTTYGMPSAQEQRDRVVTAENERTKDGDRAIGAENLRTKERDRAIAAERDTPSNASVQRKQRDWRPGEWNNCATSG